MAENIANTMYESIINMPKTNIIESTNLNMNFNTSILFNYR